MSKNLDHVLVQAAKMIVEEGLKEINISQLSKKAGVSRTSIHGTYKNSSAIYLGIISQFLKTAQSFIEFGLKVVGAQATPVERLTTIFRATLSAFEAKPHFGLVVLQQLDLSNKDERKFAFEIFERVDRIIDEARERGELASEAPVDSWKIRQTMFVLTRGLLLSLYRNEGWPGGDKSKFTDKEVEVEVLKVLTLYCSVEARARIEKIVEAIEQGQLDAGFDNKPE